MINRFFLLGYCFLIGVTSVFAQKSLADEMRELAEPLVTQISKPGSGQSVAIADFMAIDGQTCPLGAYLSEELITALFMAQDRSFNILDRSQLTKLMEEVKLRMGGLLDEENLPKLKRLKTIDVMIGGTWTVTGPYLRLTAKAIEIETGNMVGRVSDIVTYRPSMQILCGNGIGANGAISNGTGQRSGGSSQNVADLLIQCQGCGAQDGGYACTLRVENAGVGANISFFRDEVKGGLPATKPIQLLFGDDNSRSRVSQFLSPQESAKLTILFDEPISGDLSLEGYSTVNSFFQIHCSNK